MRTHVQCGWLFDGQSDKPATDRTIVFENDRIDYAGLTAQAPKPQDGDTVLDCTRDYVLPGLIDIHVHLSYGNAQANEDIDIYATPEYRALRAMNAAQLDRRPLIIV